MELLNQEIASALTAFVSVVLIDIVLAGDNALVVGLAAAGLEPHQRRRAIMIGVTLALIARIVFALMTAILLDVIGLLLAGGLLLLWVAWKMWRDIRAAHADTPAGQGTCGGRPVRTKTFGNAVWQIAVADISMSLDNVLAVAGAAHKHPWMLIFGLVLSIALMGIAAGFIARYLERHRWLGFIGVAVIAYVALSMIVRGGAEVVHAI